MKPQNRLNLVEVSTRIITKGSDRQVQLFATYLDLGLKALQDLAKRETTEKAIRDANNLKAIAEGNKKIAEEKLAKEKAKNKLQDNKPKKVTLKKKPIPKKVVKSIKKEEVKEAPKPETDPKVN